VITLNLPVKVKKKKKKKKKLDYKLHSYHSYLVFFLKKKVWVRADSIEDLTGPLYITHPSDPPICLTVDPDDRFLAYPITESPAPEPTIMYQVFVGSRIVGSTDAFTLKSANSKYLSSDKFGVVECNSEAIGGQEEWKPVATEAGFAFQNVHGKFLMADEIAGGGVRIRADADDIGFCETFRVYCQSRFKYKPKTKKKADDSIGSEYDNV
jgi:protein FRG1